MFSDIVIYSSVVLSAARLYKAQTALKQSEIAIYNLIHWEQSIFFRFTLQYCICCMSSKKQNGGWSHDKNTRNRLNRYKIIIFFIFMACMRHHYQQDIINNEGCLQTFSFESKGKFSMQSQFRAVTCKLVWMVSTIFLTRPSFSKFNNPTCIMMESHQYLQSAILGL